MTKEMLKLNLNPIGLAFLIKPLEDVTNLEAAKSAKPCENNIKQMKL